MNIELLECFTAGFKSDSAEAFHAGWHSDAWHAGYIAAHRDTAHRGNVRVAYGAWVVARGDGRCQRCYRDAHRSCTPYKDRQTHGHPYYGGDGSSVGAMPAKHSFTDDGSDPGNCSVCHFFHTDKR